MEDKKNKIDMVIDEVIESKRFKQSGKAVKNSLKFVTILGIVFFILLVIAVATGIVS